MRLRISLRAKLALVSLALLALPLAGWLYVNEMERFLLEGEERALLATARAVRNMIVTATDVLRSTRTNSKHPPTAAPRPMSRMAISGSRAFMGASAWGRLP